MTRRRPDDREGDETDQPSFTDGVMDAIARAVPPSPTRTFLVAVRLRSFGTAVSALRVAWHLGTVRTWHIAPRVRARSFALVMAVAFVLGTTTLVAAAAVTVVVPPLLDQPRSIDRTPASLPAAASPALVAHPTPTAAHDPSPTPPIIHPADPGGGTVGAPPADQTVGSTKKVDRGGDSKADHEDGASDVGDDHDPNDVGSADPPDGSDHETGDEHVSETPEPSEHDTSGDGQDGGSGTSGGDDQGDGGGDPED